MMKPILLAAAALSLGSEAAHAATVTDPAKDILATFHSGAGPFHPGNVDITSFGVNFDAATQDFSITSGFGGDVDSDNATIFVIGVNTGSATNHPFGPSDTAPLVDPDPQDLNRAVDLGGNAISFNRTFIVHQDGSVSTSGTGPSLANARADINGDTFRVAIPLSDFPAAAKGFLPQDFSFNLWTRNGLGDNHQVADFALADRMLTVGGAVPEPASWALMIGGLGLTGAALRRQRALSRIAATA